MADKRVFVLGAGASKAHSQGLFPGILDFFDAARYLGLDLDGEFNEIVAYAADITGTSPLSLNNLLDIETVFSHLEIDIEQKPSWQMLQRREQLLTLIRTVLLEMKSEIEIADNGTYGHFASQVLRAQDSVITFNWDTLLDEALSTDSGHYKQFMNLTAEYEKTWGGAFVIDPDGGYDPDAGLYLKLHGSIGWFYCSNEGCRWGHKVFKSSPEASHECTSCNESLELLLIPPVFNKKHRQYPLVRRIWTLAAKELLVATQLVIWGYSLPPADFYSDWLLRQARKASQLKRIDIVNPKEEHADRLKKLFQGMEVELTRFDNIEELYSR